MCNRKRSDALKALPYVLPGTILTALIIVYPLFFIFAMSFSEGGMKFSGFAGLSNFTRLFNNPQFTKALWNTLRFTGATVILSFIVGLLLALLINKKGIKLKGFWRSMIFIAWVMPGVVKATAWKWMLQTDGGIINAILQQLHLIKEPVMWLTNPSYAMWVIAIVQVWICAPYIMLMMTAGLQQISPDIYESASLDGANSVQRLLRITLPMLKDICFICVLMLLVWSLNEFSLIWIMTQGGKNTITLSILIYNQFKVMNLNAASASAVMQLIITMLFALVYVRIMNRKDA